jgi:hypothetical protein
MRKRLLLIALLIITLVTYSQIEATTDDGNRVSLNEDGTWNYLDTPVSDSLEFTCEEVIETKVDKMLGITTPVSLEVLVISEDGGETGFGILALKLMDFVLLSVQAVGEFHCIDDGDFLFILFRDGTRVVLEHEGDFNCEPEHYSYFGGEYGKEEILQALSTKEVEAIRVATSDAYIDRDFTPYQSKLFMKTMECLSKP